MGARSRQKGKVGEREVAALLRSEGFTGAKRGVQYQGGTDSPDVVCPELENFHIEVKRTERFRAYQAMDQSAADAGEGQIPIVFHRSNDRGWLVVIGAKKFLELVRKVKLYDEEAEEVTIVDLEAFDADYTIPEDHEW